MYSKVSSANNLTVLSLTCCGRSFLNQREKAGPTVEPWGNKDDIRIDFDLLLSETTLWGVHYEMPLSTLKSSLLHHIFIACTTAHCGQLYQRPWRIPLQSDHFHCHSALRIAFHVEIKEIALHNCVSPWNHVISYLRILWLMRTYSIQLTAYNLILTAYDSQLTAYNLQHTQMRDTGCS